MSTFKNIQGKNIRSYANNAPNATAGEMWYNRSEQKLKGVVSIEATNSGSLMINRRSLFGWGVGTGTAGLVVGGVDDSTYLSAVEEYNGSGWAAGGAYPNARYSVGSAGTQTAAIAYCGRPPSTPTPAAPNETNNYNGSSWTSGNNFPTTGNEMQGIGAVNTAVVSTENAPSTSMHHWNGTSWTAANARNTAKGGQAAFGTLTAAVLAGGYPSESTQTELYDGTNWTTSSNLVSGANQIAGSGTQTDGLAFGGDVPPGEAATTKIQTWDGTSWATSPATLATARTRAGTGRNTASGTWVAGGIGPGGGGEAFNATEEYNKSTNVTTAAAWAAGGSLNTTRRSMFVGPMGTQTAGLAAGGYVGPARTNSTEEYNGSSWTSGNNTTDTLSNRGAAGTQTAGLLFGGNPSPAVVTDTEEYDGTNWTAGGALNNARGYGVTGAGTQTAALAAGGYNPSGATFVTVTEYYNGNTWTAQPNANPNNYAGASGGTQAAAWLVGASAVSPGPANTEAYNWDGTSWTASGNYATNSVVNMFGGGTQTAGWMCGGDADPGVKTFTNHYDGSSWSTAPALGTARAVGGQSGTQSSGLIFGGGTPSNTNATEEFTGETTAANIVDITTS